MNKSWLLYQAPDHIGSANGDFIATLPGIFSNYQVEEPIAQSLMACATAAAAAGGAELQALAVAFKLRGYHGQTITNHLPRDLATPAERRFLSVLFNTCQPHNSGIAYAKNEYYCDAASKRDRRFSLRTLQRYFKSLIHSAFFISRAGAGWNATRRHQLTDGAKRFAIFLVTACRANLAANLLADLVRWALTAFLRIEKQPVEDEKPAPENVTPFSENVTPLEPATAGLPEENVTLKEDLLKGKQESKITVDGHTPNKVFSMITTLISLATATRQERHQLNRERRAARLAAEQNGRPRARDINAISTPDYRTPAGFRGADAPDQIATAPAQCILTDQERELVERAEYRAAWLPNFLVSRCKAAGVELR